jgi:hypothetical protein|nr:MAG TPA: hypothetical protein [Caudoviricetes sp.]
MRFSSAISIESQYPFQFLTFNFPLSKSLNKDFASSETSGIYFFSVDNHVVQLSLSELYCTALTILI